MKIYIIKVLRFLSRPLSLIVLGFFLAVLPVLIGNYMHGPGFVPGFNYGVFYGFGLMIMGEGVFSYFAKK